MDRVGLGRALGFGARQAARTLMKLADAATTPSPAAPGGAPVRPAVTPYSPPVEHAAPLRKPGRHTKGLGNAVLKPVAKFTSVLWLEVTGLFYAVFAAILGMAASRQWKLTFSPGPLADHTRFFIYTAVGLVFAYFSVTNFLKARRRGRQ